MRNVSPFALGGTLYMPATRPDLLAVMVGEKLPGLRSLVVCLEDAIAESDAAPALARLRSTLASVARSGRADDCRPLVFVRPRNPRMAATLMGWPEIHAIDGFVIPKLDLASLERWARVLDAPNQLLMPTLETAQVYNPAAVADLGKALRAEFGQRILAIRIGGNDLLGCLALRRPRTGTLYETPMGYVIPMLAGVLGAQGYALTAPVFEHLAMPELLNREVHLDIAHGLVGKTAIHPSQVPLIHEGLKVPIEDLNCARLIVQGARPAVFRHDDAMVEPATHYNWAVRTLECAKWHGVKPVDCSLAQAGR